MGQYIPGCHSNNNMRSWIPTLLSCSTLVLGDKGFGAGPGGLGQYVGGGGGAFGSASDGPGGIAALEEVIPGIPGEDYPIYFEVPESSFSCDGQVDGGYYADPEAECQAFHICANDGNSGLTKYSFLCPNGTLFQQQYFVCDWWFNVDCSTTEDFYGLNDEIASERAASSPGGGQGQYGGAVSGRRGASAQYSGGKSGTGKKSRKGSQASASAPRGSYSSPSSSSSSYSAPSSGYQGAQDTFGAGSGYGSPVDFGADAAYGAPPGGLNGYSRRNARGANLVVEEKAEDDEKE